MTADILWQFHAEIWKLLDYSGWLSGKHCDKIMGFKSQLFNCLFDYLVIDWQPVKGVTENEWLEDFSVFLFSFESCYATNNSSINKSMQMSYYKQFKGDI